MATCADFQKELDQQRSDFTSYLSRGNQSISRGSGTLPTDIPSLSSISNAVNVDLGQAQIVVTYLTQFIEQATRAGCKAQADQARALLNQFTSLAQRLEPIVTKVNAAYAKAQQATRQSTQSTNNAGNGDPGSAGKGPGASIPVNAQGTGTAGAQFPANTNIDDPDANLPTVTVTGSRLNNNLEISDPNIPGTAGDVNVSAPNINFGDNLVVDEPGMIGAGPINVDAPNFNLPEDDGLEEVVVTARRPNSTTGATNNARNQTTQRESTNFKARKDWRVRLALSPGSTYLYNDSSNTLLEPLRTTDGVIFPYTPNIQVTYGANYQPSDPAHSNYRYYQYENSYVDNINIGCEFTAQDTTEARYLLAVIHFFRSATKMFYGQDQNPKPGTPPPMCFLYGLGEFQFNAHPLAIQNFNYVLPSDVDYIRAGANPESDGLEEVTITGKRTPNIPNKPVIKKGWGQMAQDYILNRLGAGAAGIGNALGLKLQPGGALSAPDWVQSGFKPGSFVNEQNVTYVPTKINLQISCVPIMSRYETSNVFSLKDYANGNLIRGYGAQGRKGAGHW